MSRITFISSLESQLRGWLLGHPDGHERAAIVLFRKLDRLVRDLPESPRFLAVDFIKIPDDSVISSSPTHIDFNTRFLPEIYFRCENENLELGFVHNHPSGYDHFSQKDDKNELTILRGLSGCNGLQAILVSMILVDDHWKARLRKGTAPNEILPIRHISTLGEKLTVQGITQENDLPQSLARQEAAFGKPFNRILQSLRVAVVGVGGTGSPAATLLARAGIGELILIDGDTLDGTNMNRVRGYNADHVGKNKAESLLSFITSLGLNVKVCAIPKYISEPEALDALSTADVVFGCTDDQIGRNIMNQALYYYGQVLIDSGLTGFIDTDPSGMPYLRDHRGRVSCILPESGACLKCQKVITEERLRYEQAVKDRPELAKLDAETLEKEYYLRGGGVQAPGVGPFTSATADNAVATLMDLIRQFRKLPTDLRRDNIWIDFVHLYIHSNEPVDDSSCIYCRERKVVLKAEGKYRLEMPSLGKYENIKPKD